MKAVIATLALAIALPSQAANLSVPYTVNRKWTGGEEIKEKISLVIMYGRDAAVMPHAVLVTLPALGDPISGTYVVRNVDSGTWYVAAMVLTESGVESPVSNTARRLTGLLPGPPIKLEVK